MDMYIRLSYLFQREKKEGTEKRELSDDTKKPINSGYAKSSVEIAAESCFAFGAQSTLCIFGIALVPPHPTNIPVNSFRPRVNSEMKR